MEKGGRGGQTKEGNKEREGEESSTYYPLQLIGPDFRSTEMGILNRRTSIRNSYSTQCRFRNPENSESTHDINKENVTRLQITTRLKENTVKACCAKATA